MKFNVRNIVIVIALLEMCMASMMVAQTQKSQQCCSEVYTVIANPGELSARSARINWHTDLNGGESYCIYTECCDSDWKKAKRKKAEQHICLAYDGIFSKKASHEDFYENARFIRNTIELKKLKPDTRYMYQISTDKSNKIRYFKTAPLSNEWTSAVISDFHFYPPLPNRVISSMGMINTLEKCNGKDLDFVLHAGDVCAWGGSYSFWRSLYEEPHFSKYMWAGVNGNHDNMDRNSERLSNDYFHYANNNPENGYKGEKGVCYHFKYGNTLFIMLNNESMLNQEGFVKAQNWVRKTIKSNPAQFIVVMQHYQWFYGTKGTFSEYDRWCSLFDECGVDLAISGNRHIYARTNAIYQGKETEGSKGTVYVQTPSSDNERGVADFVWTDDRVKSHWWEGRRTLGGLLLKANDQKISVVLYNRKGNVIDQVDVISKR